MQINIFNVDFLGVNNKQKIDSSNRIPSIGRHFESNCYIQYIYNESSNELHSITLHILNRYPNPRTDFNILWMDNFY